jgi:hypothetical protein
MPTHTIWWGNVYVTSQDYATTFNTATNGEATVVARCIICGKHLTDYPLDYLCSPECRKTYYVKNRGWTEPSDTSGWYIAEFKDSTDVYNHSPQVIKEWNDKVTLAKVDEKKILEEIRNTRQFITNTARKANEIATEYPGIEGFDGRIFVFMPNQFVGLTPEELIVAVEKFKGLVKTNKVADYRRMNEATYQARLREESLNRGLHEAESYSSRPLIHPNR